MISGLSFNYDLSKLKGAEYNPRKIDDEALARLKESLSVVGCVKPIIARGNTIVAGHQRTKALRALGHTEAPVYLLSINTTIYDEVRFNQLHNGTDLDRGDENVRVDLPPYASGYIIVPPEAISGNLRASGAVVREEILRLILKYGPWGGVVATQSGEVFHAAQYALACKVAKQPLLVHVIPPQIEVTARHYLEKQYGVFCYDGLSRNTYMQTFAQMMRLRDGPSGKQNRSPTYENLVIPWLAKYPQSRVLDFGCGQGDYVRRLIVKGRRIIGVEFFRRKHGTQAIDVTAVNCMINALISHLKTHGRFDAVVCDYVLNSVDSQQAEDDVLDCLQSFCKPGGHIFFSGRRMERIIGEGNYTSRASSKRGIEFMDENGLTALYRKGSWFYQKFHSAEDVIKICIKRGWEPVQDMQESDTAWQSHVINTKESLPQKRIEAVIGREFNMKLGASGRTLGRHEDVKEALLCLL
jgi:ParB family transcriptional regulator, chromosome partitioning protein